MRQSDAINRINALQRKQPHIGLKDRVIIYEEATNNINPISGKTYREPVKRTFSEHAHPDDWNYLPMAEVLDYATWFANTTDVMSERQGELFINDLKRRMQHVAYNFTRANLSVDDFVDSPEKLWKALDSMAYTARSAQERENPSSRVSIF